MECVLVKVFATTLDAYKTCLERRNTKWADEHHNTLVDLTRDFMPSGCGFNSGTTLLIEDSIPDHLVFETSFQHMDDNGYYNGWTKHRVTKHRVTVRPSLVHDFILQIDGPDRNDIIDFLTGIFDNALRLKMAPDYEQLTSPQRDCCSCSLSGESMNGDQFDGKVSMERTLVNVLATALAFYKACQENHHLAWMEKHEEMLLSLTKDFMPKGAKMLLGPSKPDCLIFEIAFHHKGEQTIHRVTVRPSLICRFTFTVSGQKGHGVKDHIVDAFETALNQIVAPNKSKNAYVAVPGRKLSRRIHPNDQNTIRIHSGRTAQIHRRRPRKVQ